MGRKFILSLHFKKARNEDPKPGKTLLSEAIKDLQVHLRTEKEDEDDKSLENPKAYLKFLRFCLAENFSFNQISSLGKYLKEFVQDYGTSVFSFSSFDREEISKVVSRCFGNTLLEEIKKDLEENKFSFTIDASTIHKENICAITAKYIKKNEDGTLVVCNKLIGIEDLEVRNTGKTFFEIVKKRLMSNEKICSNFVGWSHDHGGNLTGLDVGLRAHLKELFGDKYFFDLNDPCHSLSFRACSKRIA